MAKFCHACGNEIPEGVQFCNNCGTPVAAPTPSVDPAQGMNPNMNQGMNQGMPQYNQGYNQGMPQYNQGYNQQQYNGQASKSKVTAGILGLLLGAWGIHNFYLGKTSRGVIQIFVTIFTCGIGSLWGVIEGIMILCGSINTDGNGNPLSD